MKINLSIFEALGHETRYKVFDLIFRSGSNGVRPRDMINQFGFDSGTLDFHLKKLVSAKLIYLKAGGTRGVYCFCEDIPHWLIQSFSPGHIGHELLASDFSSPSISKQKVFH